MGDIVLGLDGGGTKVSVEAATLDGAVCGRGAAGACNVAVMPVEDALAAALDAIGQALAEAGSNSTDIRALSAGIAGISFGERAAAFADGLALAFPAARVQALPDYAIAHTAALNGQPGIVVIAGTGSIAYGEDAAGRSHHAGGRGYLIDDAGSGYGVGRSALAAALRAADGSGPQTALRDMLFRRFSLKAPTDAIPLVYGGALDRAAIAGLAEMVAKAAATGDAVATSTLASAGADLAQIVRAIYDKLFPANLPSASPSSAASGISAARCAPPSIPACVPLLRMPPSRRPIRPPCGAQSRARWPSLSPRNGRLKSIILC
jgi:N-acetylglucosamine kinase-like BadF-type ATPase